MQLFNTLTRKKESFMPLKDNLVRMYTCGPTVYNFAHIGNFRSYLFEDLLRRWLLYRGFNVKQVMNLTDVDDKTIRDSKKAGISLKEFTERYTKAFFEDCTALNIQRAEVYPKATEHINEMVSMVKLLLEKGFAYRAEDGIYFSISKFKGYGKLSKVDLSQLKAGASGRVRSDEYDKDNVADFALWKFWDKDDGDVFWETEIGKGRPGWHIECSAMSAKHLTGAFQNSTFHPENFDTIDVHTGGVDNMFPHHEGEIAQTEALTNKKFSNFWLHAEHLLVENKKMSKSLGNFYTLRDLLEKGYYPLAVRYLLISTHYRNKLNFTFDALDAASTAVQRFNDFVLRLREIEKEGGSKFRQLIEKHLLGFERALDDDLEISTALAEVFSLMSEVNKLIDNDKLSSADAELVLDFMFKVDTVLGVLTERDELSAELQKLLEERKRARENKDWERSDELRDILKGRGIAVEDTEHGQRWKRIFS